MLAWQELHGVMRRVYTRIGRQMAMWTTSAALSGQALCCWHGLMTSQTHRCLSQSTPHLLPSYVNHTSIFWAALCLGLQSGCEWRGSQYHKTHFLRSLLLHSTSNHASAFINDFVLTCTCMRGLIQHHPQHATLPDNDTHPPEHCLKSDYGMPLTSICRSMCQLSVPMGMLVHDCAPQKSLLAMEMNRL